MVEIRWHGRGGQGAKSASQLLAMAQMRTGLYVQAFPEYGPERSGAPMRAYNRADGRPIRRHDGVRRPAYAVVLDPTLVGETEVAEGLAPDGLLLVNRAGGEGEIRRQTGHPGAVWCVDGDALAARAGTRYANVVLLGALAAALGDLPPAALDAAVRELMGERLGGRLEATLRAVALGYEAGRALAASGETAPLAPAAAAVAVVAGGAAGGGGRFQPFSLPGARVIPDVQVRPRTGGWRTGRRPRFELDQCVNCLLCWSYCPDRAIRLDDGQVVGIDYDLCKGCEICVAACPTQALTMVAEAGGMGDGHD
jgi:pyruvate ferredoxin oxidoreductase gamma subunit